MCTMDRVDWMRKSAHVYEHMCNVTGNVETSKAIFIS